MNSQRDSCRPEIRQPEVVRPELIQHVKRPLASLSLDLDDKWSYMKTHGDARWASFPSYLDIVIPRVLSFLDKLSLRITFFLIGQDAEFPSNWRVLGSIAEAGHEIGNHSFHHEPWLHLYSKHEIETEIARAEDAIGNATGQLVKGFRGPGFSISESVAEVLASRGYRYDASTLPTFLGPAARAYYLLTAKLDKEEKRRRARLFGRFRDGLRPLKPYRWTTACGPLVEIPVTTMPILRTPFHLSYLVWLHSHSESLARTYRNLALGLCNAARIAPSFLLHPLDFLGPREAPELAFFPGMNVPLSEKLSLAEETLTALARRYTLGTMAEHASKTLGKRQVAVAASEGFSGSSGQ
jgi:peptidoglycan/xylan/chitin deacetylase (PgdA/CDA1 family)